MAELADALDLGSSPLLADGGSSPPSRTQVPPEESGCLYRDITGDDSMKISIETLSPVQKKIAFEIPPDQVQAGLEKAYRTYQNQVRLKGFRAGRVPRPVLERHFGEQVAAEVSSSLVEESLMQALEEHDLAIVTKPQVVTERLVAVKPEVHNVDYEGLEVKKVIASVEEREVDESLVRLADSLAQLHPITGRDTVESGDVVTLDYHATQLGHPISGLEGKSRLVEVGKETLLPGFQEQLVGVRKGQTVEFSLPVPKAENAEETASVTADFRVTVHDLANKEVPLLDDEFAKDHGECETLEELRAKIRENIEQMAERRAEGQMHEDLIDQLLSRNPFDIPPGLIREQTQQLLVEAGVQRQENDSSQETTIPEAVRAGFSLRAKRQIQTTVILDALAGQIGLTITAEEVDQKAAEFASASVDHRQQIEAFYTDPTNRRMLEGRLLREQGLRAVVEKANVRIVPKDVAGEQGTD